VLKVKRFEYPSSGAESQKIGITVIRYAESKKIGITFIRYAES
jgi:hypothetical protein